MKRKKSIRISIKIFHNKKIILEKILESFLYPLGEVEIIKFHLWIRI